MLCSCFTEKLSGLNRQPRTIKNPLLPTSGFLLNGLYTPQAEIPFPAFMTTRSLKAAYLCLGAQFPVFPGLSEYNPFRKQTQRNGGDDIHN